MFKKLIRYLSFTAMGATGLAAVSLGLFTPLVMGGDGMANGAGGDRYALIDVLLPVIGKADAQGFNIPNNSRVIGKLLAGPQGTGPTINSGTISPGSSSSFGQFTAGGATAVLTFSSAFTNAPWCLIVDATTSSTGLKYTISTTAVTITGGLTTNDKVNFMCIGS